jgi:hypothetical protein
MRRVQESFMWEINVWMRRADDVRSRSDGNQDGQASYALRQADIRESMLAHCRDVWEDAYRLLHNDADALEDPAPQRN